MFDPDPTLPCIAIVDDDPDQLFLSRRMLEKTGLRHPILEFGGGADLIDYLTGCGVSGNPAQATFPAVVLLDLKMPNVDGFAVLEWMQCNPALNHVKVIMLSTSDDPEDVKRCTNLGAQGFLVKHPNAAVVSCVLRQALSATASANSFLHSESK